jgi:hypothetical protein
MNTETQSHLVAPCGQSVQAQAATALTVKRDEVTQLTITDAPALDGIQVICQNFEPGRGMITIVCYGRAWTAYWGSMSGSTVQEFVARVGAGYVVSNLVRGMGQRLKRAEKTEDAYLQRIVEAVQMALRQEQGAAS